MRDYYCHTVSFIINAFEKSVNYPFKENINVAFYQAYAEDTEMIFGERNTILLWELKPVAPRYIHLWPLSQVYCIKQEERFFLYI